MRFWHRLLAFLGLSPPSAEAAPHPCSGAAEARETPAAELANALTPLSAAGDERNRKENDCGEDLTRFLLYANRHAKARLRRCDSRGRWWLFETDNEGNLTATVYRLEPTAPRGLAEFLASRRMSISYPLNGCERAWLDDPQAAAEKFHGALADALLALRATAQGAAKPNSLLAQLIYPGGDARFSRWIERLVEIYKQSLLGVAAISSREGQQPPQRHLAVVLNHDLRTTASAAIAEMVAAVAAEARDAGIAAPAFVLSPALLWEECRCGKPRGVRLLAAAEPLYDTPFLAALRAYDKHVQAVVDRMGEMCHLYLLQGDILGGVPQEDGDLQAAVLINDSAYKGAAPAEELRRNLQQKLEQDWHEATARCGSRFRLKLCVLFSSELPAADARGAVAALGGGVPLFSRSPLGGSDEKNAAKDGVESNN